MVATKLKDLPEVSRVKLRDPKPGRDDLVEVSLKDGGILILDERYDLKLVFDDFGLAEVKLNAANTCSNDAYARYARLIAVLSAKYPQSPIKAMPIHDEGSFIDGRMKRLNGLRSSLSTAVSNGATVAKVIVRFERIERPITSSGPAAQLGWQLYKIRADQCGGSGANRTLLTVSYSSTARFESDLIRRRIDRDQQDSEAKDRL